MMSPQKEENACQLLKWLSLDLMCDNEALQTAAVSSLAEKMCAMLW